MKIRQLPSSFETSEGSQHLTTYLINDCVAIDAGCLGFLAPVADQKQITNVLISHSHIDHVASLPLFLDNVFQPGYECPSIFASRDVWRSLTSDVFNERLWPDLSRIGDKENRFFEQRELTSEVPILVDDLTITPVLVNHVVPTVGFLIEDDHSSAVISSDTGPTERLWELGNRSSFREKLGAVFLECSFPNDHAWLAVESRHLCTASFATEIAKINSGPPFLTIAVHLKAPMNQQICRELRSLKLANFQIGGRDQTWNL